jgi:hypothetical protein
MLHNSLTRREMLRAMNSNPLVVHRRDVHRNVGIVPDAKPSSNQIALSGPWSIRTARDLPPERAVANDAKDFLSRMNVTIDQNAPKQILLEIGSSNAGFRTVVAPDRIEVHAADASALWSGWVHLENAIRRAGGAILSTGEEQRTPAWPVQIAPPTWGSNYAVPDLSPEYLPDDAFRSLAHAGANGMFVYGDFLLYAENTKLTELNYPDAAKNIAMLRDATERAAAYGVSLYFCAVGPKLPADHALFKRLPNTRGAQLATQNLHCLCSSDPDALVFHAEVFANLFKQVPALGGLILIIGGESYYHCFMRAAGAGVGHTNCKQCEGKLAEDVIANLLDTTSKAAQSEAPGGILVTAWPYSAQAFWSTEPNQLKLIDRLPENVALQSEIGKDQTITRHITEGPAAGSTYNKTAWDYSLDYVGPSDRIIAQALHCAQRDRKLVIKSETSYGIELLHFPYTPCMQHSGEEWQHLRTLRPHGILQRWGFIGMFDSPAERLGYLARWDPNFAPETSAREIAQQLYGPAAAKVAEAWSHFSRAVQHIPCLTTGGYYIGPGFLGPCHPLPTWTGPTPDAFCGSLYYLQELDATFTHTHEKSRDDLTLHSTKSLGPERDVVIFESEFSVARDHAKKGHDMLQSIDTTPLAQHHRDEVIEQQAIGEYLYRQFRTTTNVIRFLRLKEKGQTTDLPAIAKDELDNTRAARSIYERAPWLSHHLRLDLAMNPSIQMIDAKIALLEAFAAHG